DEAVAAAAAARSDAEQARQRARDHSRDADRFAHLAELLAVELRGRPAPDGKRPRAFRVPADPEQARTAVDALRARLADRAASAERSTRLLSQSAAEVRRFVTDAEFAALD